MSAFKFRSFIFLIFLFVSGLHAETPPAQALPGASIYNLDTTWTNQDGKKMKLGDLRGHPVLITMVYLTCGYACPTMITEMKDIEAKFTNEQKQDLRVLMISFDPKRDTPKAMRQYMEKRKLDQSRWSFMTSNDEGKIRELAAVLNFKYQKTDDGEYTHSSVIAVLDRQGVLLSTDQGASGDILKKVFAAP